MNKSKRITLLLLVIGTLFGSLSFSNNFIETNASYSPSSFESVSDGYYIISDQSETGYNFNCPTIGEGQYVEIQQNGTQYFYVSLQSDGAYSIRYSDTNYVLTIEDSSQTESSIILSTDTGADNQRWFIRPTEYESKRTYFFEAKNSGSPAKAIGFVDSTKYSGNKLNCKKNNTDASQRWFLLPSEDEAVKTIEDGKYNIISSSNNSYGLNGETIQTLKLSSTTLSVFNVTYSDGYYKINVDGSSDKYLTNASHYFYNNNNVYTYYKREAGALDYPQCWMIIPITGGGYEIVVKAAYKALTIENDTIEENANLVIYRRKQSTSQKWLFVSVYTLTYETNGGSSIDPITTSTLPNPLPTPTKSGYVFAGWYMDSEFTTPATAGDTLTEDTTIYAKWALQSDYSIKEIKQVGGYITDKGKKKQIVAFGFQFVGPSYPSNDSDFGICAYEEDESEVEYSKGTIAALKENKNRFYLYIIIDESDSVTYYARAFFKFSGFTIYSKIVSATGNLKGQEYTIS